MNHPGGNAACMICEECGCEATGNARGWRGYSTRDIDGELDREVLFYCPVCAFREFGPLRHRASGDEEIQD